MSSKLRTNLFAAKLAGMAGDDNKRGEFDTSDEEVDKVETTEIDLLRVQIREHGRKLGELEQRFDTMDEHLGKLSGLVKQALKELQKVHPLHEKTTEKLK